MTGALARRLAFCILGLLASTKGRAEPTSDANPWGIASSSSARRNMDEWFPKVSAAGVEWIRLSPEWRGIEPVKGSWKWDNFDALLASADSNSLRISAILMGCAAWSKDGGHAFPMTHLDDWSTYVATVVDRYRSRIHHWEVWNEGNGGFNDNHNTTVDYAALVAASSAAVKKSDPAAQVGMSVASFDAPYLLQAAAALRRTGNADCFDHLCIHPYEIADGISEPDGELPYLWMSKLLRDALKAGGSARANADIWITEIGRNINTRNANATEPEAAKALVKLYVMAAAQGIKRTMWFEGQDPHGEEAGFGLIDREGRPRASYRAFKTMTSCLGATPIYQGWLTPDSDGRGYGFVFQGATASVMVAWMPAGGSNSATFANEVTVVDSLTAKESRLKAGERLALTDTAVFVVGLSADRVAQARAHAAKNFPWGGDYSAAKRVSIQLGTSATNNGLFKRSSAKDSFITFPDGSSGLYVPDNRSSPFFVHPSFAGLTNSNYYVRLTLRRIGPGNVGMNFHHEIADSQGRSPYRGTGEWFSLPEDEGWQTHTWHVSDACFSKMWGFDFAFNPEKSVPFVIGKVEVSTEPL